MVDYDASNPKHVTIQRRQAKIDDGLRETFLNTVMGMANGRQYIYDLLLRCHVFTQPFSADPHVTAFACGELNIGQSILADIMRFCPDYYIQMMREANARAIAFDQRLERSNKDSNGGDSESPEYVHPAFDSARPSSPPAAVSEYDPGDEAEAGDEN